MKPDNFKISTIGIYINSSRDIGYDVSAGVVRFLSKRGVDTRLIGDSASLTSRALNLQAAGTEEVDCVVAMGGDGTLLRAARAAARFDKPVMGINLGRLGYLTDASADSALLSLERLLSGCYTLERRVMLEAGTGNETVLALNDAFVTRSGPPKSLMLRVEINGEHMDTYQADGILVSTPTGSTAYNLSAGGPVIKPDADILAITPVCPHALHVRSAVVAASDIVTVRVLSPAGGSLFMDGICVAEMARDGKVDIRRSQYKTTIIKTQEKGFYEILREKMNWE